MSTRHSVYIEILLARKQFSNPLQPVVKVTFKHRSVAVEFEREPVVKDKKVITVTLVTIVKHDSPEQKEYRNLSTSNVKGVIHLFLVTLPAFKKPAYTC